ncbi:GNAT family N-acetyltransferase [Actinoplanes rectilineatus]|uniref:GNAT family N-acetyltransferase n=1 Tax=Actinoplanes rectilineatus TaxID=113571 RepID=UPI000698C32F|nr:GNAT family N-acetyltransferase [Actinoplanes rectilineatus]
MIEDLDAERAEAEFMHDYLVGMPEPERTRLGVTAARIGGGVALAMAADPTNYWSKALGFDPGALDEVISFYRTSGVRQAVIQLTGLESAPPELERGGTWIKLGADPRRVTAAPTSLRVGPVPDGEAVAWANVILDTFGMPRGDLTTMLASTVGRPGWQPFAAWDGDRIVAGANLFHQDGRAALNAAATLPEYRGRGAQSALIAARAAAAAEAGCHRVYAETGKPEPGGHNPSLANMVRAGLEPLYERDNWIWRSPGAGVKR